MSIIHEQEEFAVQRENLAAGVLSWIVAGIAIIVIVIVVIAVNVTGQRLEEASIEATTYSEYPELRQVRANSQQKLMHFEILDKEAGIYRIPIERAMVLVIERSAADATGSPELRLAQ